MDSLEESLEDNTKCSISSGTIESQLPRAGNSPGSGRLSAIFLVINAALGAGLLNFPQAFDQAGGILTALTVQAVLIVWIVGALLILAHCADKAGALTIQDVLQAACGKTGLITCSILVALYCFGTCVTFLIIIGDQFDRVLLTVWGKGFCHLWYLDRSFTMTMSSVMFILPLCFSKRIDFLRYVSSVGVIAVLYVVGLIAYKYCLGNFVPGPIKTSPLSWTDIFLVVPAICFGYQCHVSIIPIYSCLQHRNLHNFSVVCMFAVVFCVAAYTIAGVCGYLTFGSLVTSDILESYSGENPFVLLGIGAIAIKTFTTYPLLLFCGREAISTVWCELFGSSQTEIALTEFRRRVTIASLWFISTLLIAVVSPDIGVVIDVLGSLAAIFIFVFPGLCLLQSTLRSDPGLYLNKHRFLVLAAFAFIVVGTFMFGVVLTQAIERFADISTNTQRLCE
ncbi:putative sodium-coupled neutral amino acid transporter 7 [Frankliniella occidentalis]|uniref:Sodium-coupled neutral amino acid transporter 7 n=1 Tax=Frankliniella occidentalis TaxID=133901 RepID=A0A6J1SGA7_FRAOC|nr:putative sodium-coupled neutral amino acid transporter 7 [Frankliniella occidentalis]